MRMIVAVLALALTGLAVSASGAPVSDVFRDYCAGCHADGAGGSLLSDGRMLVAERPGTSMRLVPAEQRRSELTPRTHTETSTCPI